MLTAAALSGAVGPCRPRQQDSAFSSGFGVWGLGFGVSGLGFRGLNTLAQNKVNLLYGAGLCITKTVKGHLSGP